MSRAAFLLVVLTGFAAAAEDELHESDYAVKLGATFFETSAEANGISADGGYQQAAEVWTKMIAAQEPGVPAAWRAELFKPAKGAETELLHRAEWNAQGNAEALRRLFRSVVRGSDWVEHAEVGERRLTTLTLRLLAYDADTSRVLGAPFQVLVEVKGYDDAEKKTLTDQLMQALRKTGLKAELKPPVKEVRRVLKISAQPGKTTAPPRKLDALKSQLPATAKSCAIEMSAELTEDDKVLLKKTDLSSRAMFGNDEQCRAGPLRVGADMVGIRLIEAAMPK
jgi:hypothetical protein